MSTDILALGRRRLFVVPGLCLLYLVVRMILTGFDGYELALMGSVAVLLYLHQRAAPRQRAYLFAAGISVFTAFAAILPAWLGSDRVGVVLALVFWGAVTTFALIWARIHVLDTPA
ncbi:MAG: hypothetical protein V4574_05095 [Pseudomonadota bacterium]